MAFDKPTITELPTGEFEVKAHEAWIVRHTGVRTHGYDVFNVTIPRDVMLTFLGEFSEKVLQLRLDAMKEAREVRDRLMVTRVLPPHTRLCADGHCHCPSAS